MSNKNRYIITRRQLITGVIQTGIIANATLAAETGHADSTPNTSFDPTEDYVVQKLGGWKLFINPKLEKSDIVSVKKVIELLDFQLFQMIRVVPDKALAQLQKIPIWVELAEGHHPCMAYHPGAKWLREHGMNPDKEGCVEIANSLNFLKWTIDQPWMVLHEMSHAYHDKVLNFENAMVKTTYDAAVASKSYESVLRYTGQMERHYALANEREYFAECSEAYFGTNDFYPFIRAELNRHDAKGYAMIRRAWGVDDHVR